MILINLLWGALMAVIIHAGAFGIYEIVISRKNGGLIRHEAAQRCLMAGHWMALISIGALLGAIKDTTLFEKHSEPISLVGFFIALPLAFYITAINLGGIKK